MARSREKTSPSPTLVKPEWMNWRGSPNGWRRWKRCVTLAAWCRPCARCSTRRWHCLRPSVRPGIESLTGEQAPFKDTLRELLAAYGQVETGTFLPTPPELASAGDAAPDNAGLAAGDMVGPYRLISVLGRGGMGTVWLAERSDGRLKRQVALKLPHLIWGDALAERLSRERDILASLEHAHIARLYDAGVDRQGRPYLAMEYVDGQTIDVYCHQRALPVA